MLMHVDNRQLALGAVDFGVFRHGKNNLRNYILAIMAQGFSIFETAIGPCGIVWNDYGIVGVQLPEATEGRTRSRLLKRFREARETGPSPEISGVIDKIIALLRGEKPDFSGAKLDIKTLPEFNHRVYKIASAIPHGAVMTYGEIAAKL